MTLTLHAVLAELDKLSAQGELDEIGREEIVDSVARAALLGARGNSGVILSQLIRGAAEELISRPGELVDPVLIAAAMARAAERAYGSVRAPAEGTILTVMREMAARASSQIAHMEQPRLTERVDDRRQAEILAEVLEARARRRPGLGAPRAGAARGAADGRRGRRRRLRAHDPLRGHGRRAARHAAAGPRPPRAGAHHPPAARVLDLSLLHELRGHGLRSRPDAVARAARAPRRLGARGRRPLDAEDPPPHRRAGARHRAVRRRRGGLAPRRGRHDRAGRRACAGA